MSYVALYRKFRPSTFDEVRGQDAIVTTLRNQIKAGRIGHAYLFVGTRGTGKTTVAKILARAVNCTDPQDGSPCGKCEVCRAMESGAALNVVEMDAASNNSVEDVRQIVDEVEYTPAVGRYRVYIIDEVHMFSKAAFNALLKTLEEPPAHVIFILATTDLQSIPVTILSRCQRYDFRRIDLEEIKGRLTEVAGAEGIAVTPEAIAYIARSADGAMRDALSLLDQCAAFHFGEELTLDKVLDILGAVEVETYGRLLDALLAGDVAASLDQIALAVADGRDLSQYVGDFIWYLRNLMLIRAAGDASHVMDISTENLAIIKEKAAQTDIDVLLRYIRIFSELHMQIRYSTQKRILTEMAVIRLLRPQTESADTELSARVRALEDRAEQEEKRISRISEDIQNGAVTVTAGPRSGAGDDEEKKKQLTEAIARAMPEEAREVLARKREILRRLPQLQQSVLERTDFSVDRDGNLLIASPGFDFTSLQKMNTNYDPAETLRQAIIEVIGKEVPVRFADAEESDGNGERYVSGEDILRIAGIQMEITEEDH